jgi:hypothetical protein
MPVPHEHFTDLAAADIHRRWAGAAGYRHPIEALDIDDEYDSQFAEAMVKRAQ